MKFLVRNTLFVIYAIALTGSFTNAQQDLSVQLSRAGEKNVQNYISPLLAGFAADINSATYHSAEVHNLLGFDIQIKQISVLTVDGDRKFNFQMPDNINFRLPNGSQLTLRSGDDYDAVIPDAPTVLGETNQTNVFIKINPASSNYSYHTQLDGQMLMTLPRGYSTMAVPLLVPQLSFGLPFGLEAMVRYMPTTTAMNVGDAGKYNYMGYCLRYDIGQWMQSLPLNIAIHYSKQRMVFKSADEKDIFSANGTAYGLEASKGLSILTLYCGFQLESAIITLNQVNGSYNTQNGAETTFTIPERTYDGKNKSRVTVGLSILLSILTAHAEYSIAATPVIAVGIGFSTH